MGGSKAMKKEPKLQPSGSQGMKQYPGCMGSLLHWFDFGQNGGKKYLTDKACAERSELSRSILAASDNRDTEKALDRNFLGSGSKKKKKRGLPMKALIAEEMSKETESKRRAPGVVARLMGLETYPSESMLAKHMQSPGRESKLQGPDKASYERGKSSAKWVPPISREISFERKIESSESQKIYRRGLEDLKAAALKDRSKSERLDELSVQLDQKRMLVQETLNEAKIAIARTKFSDAKLLAPDNKSLQSKDFLDTLAVLKSDKELFLKFIEEPNLLFAKHLQDPKPASYVSLESKKSLRGRPGSGSAKDKLIPMEDASQARNQPATASKMQEKQLHRQNGRKVSSHKDEWFRRSSFSGSTDQNAQYHRADDTMKADTSLPTRIVVLKPGPGNVHSERHASAPQSRNSSRRLDEGEKATTRQFLEEIRERLRSGLKENEKQRFKFPQENVRVQSNDGPKDPREIAREIARQVRESVTRDITKNYSRAGAESRNRRSSFGQPSVRDDTRDGSFDSKDSFDYSQIKDDPSEYMGGKGPTSSESTFDKEAKKRLSERLKQTHMNDNEDHQTRRAPDTLGKMLSLRQDAISTSQSEKFDHKMKGSVLSEENGVLSIEPSAGLSSHVEGPMHEEVKNGSESCRRLSGGGIEVDFGAEYDADQEAKAAGNHGLSADDETKEGKAQNYNAFKERFADTVHMETESLGSLADVKSEASVSTPEGPQQVTTEDQGSSASSTCCSPEKQVVCGEHKCMETKNEKAEHSSPVSVLDSPFEEETLSPQCFDDINTNLQELRLNLQLLKFDGAEGTVPKTDKYDPVLDDQNERTCNTPSEACSSSPLSGSSFPVSDFDSLPLDEIDCPEDRMDALRYVRVVLVASGFSADSLFACWYSPNRPLDPSICNKIESFLEINGSRTESFPGKWDHMLLFDCINEILLKLLGPFINHRPWLKNTKLNCRRMPTGKQLLKETWAEISCYLNTDWDSNNLLEDIILRDLDKERSWVELRSDTEAVGSELERELFDDLVEEFICDLYI